MHEYVGDRYGLFTHTLRYWMNSDSVYEGFVKRFHPKVSLTINRDPFDWQVIILILDGFISEKKEKLQIALGTAIKSLS